MNTSQLIKPACPQSESAPTRSCVAECSQTKTAKCRHDQVRDRQNKPLSLALERLANDREMIAAAGNRTFAYQTAKRVIDIVGALLAIALLSPILLTTLAVLTITTGARPFFVQRRVGFRGKRFPMLKFRTMQMNAETIRHSVTNEHQSGPIFKNRRDPRITRFGRLLRQSSIDEMPQLLNVLAGHMSLVGPRPPIASEVEQYESWQRRRLATKPGLTCLWQVSGRSEIGFEDWVRMDIWYINNQSIKADLSLLLRTPWAVLTGRGAY